MKVSFAAKRFSQNKRNQEKSKPAVNVQLHRRLFYWPRKARKIFRRDIEMIIIVKPDAKEERIHDLVKWIEAQGLRTHLSKGDYTTIIGVIGDISRLDDELLSGLDIVESVKHVSEPFKNANRKFHPLDSVVKVGEAQIPIGHGNFAVIAARARSRAKSRLSPLRRALRPPARRCSAAEPSSRARRPTTSRAQGRRYQPSARSQKRDWASDSHGNYEREPSAPL